MEVAGRRVVPQGWTLVQPSSTGLLEPGNIDMGTRPRVKNPDGSVSTVRSMSVNMDGREVLIPTVSDDGRIMGNDEAVANYRKTGKHLGMFDTAANATAFAQALHNSEAAKLDAPSGADGWTLVKRAGASAALPTRPVSAEDFAPVKTSTPREFAKGVLKGTASSLAGIGEMMANAGMLPGVLPNMGGPEALRNPVFRRVEEATTAANPAQKAGKTAETVAELAAPAFEAGKAGVALAKAAPALLGKVAPAAVEIASHVPIIGAPVRMARTAAKLLGHVLDLSGKEAPQASNAGGRLVKSSAAKIEEELARTLEELRAPEAPQSVELPPPAELPPGYVPRTDAPPVTVPANAGGRLVPPQTPTTAQALADALAEARVPEPPVRVTTPPEASLPPGYTPRSTVPKPTATPKPRAAKADLPEPVKKAIAAGERKRAYFLKPVEELADAAATAAEPAVAPSGSLTKADLPASWRSHTGQDIFPLTGDEGKAVVAGLRDELKARGVSIGQARMEISRNRSLPTEIRAQLLRALEQSGKVK